MSKLVSASKLPEKYIKSDLFRILTDIDTQVNNLSEGKVSGLYQAVTAISSVTAVPHAQGDRVWKSNATVQGTVGAQYVTIGWVCTVSGTPGTFVELRCLTGT